MKSSRVIAPVLVAVVMAVGGCPSSPSAPCPSDQELVKRLASQKGTFRKLAANPGNQALLSALKIERAVQRSAKPKQIWFPVWSQDFFGPGGCAKGYAYCEEAPKSLVDSIDANSDPGSPEVKEIYRHLEGNWYLYYHSDN